MGNQPGYFYYGNPCASYGCYSFYPISGYSFFPISGYPLLPISGFPAASIYRVPRYPIYDYPGYLPTYYDDRGYYGRHRRRYGTTTFY
ncbi:unnamed protein product [Rotaria sp. Silwood1]|nr:unnamed protein product [Rotaria sp. Silwood1]CAF3596790.1 unnamed protein product [Rotaria sp. Silwood1]